MDDTKTDTNYSLSFDGLTNPFWQTAGQIYKEESTYRTVPHTLYTLEEVIPQSLADINKRLVDIQVDLRVIQQQSGVNERLTDIVDLNSALYLVKKPLPAIISRDGDIYIVELVDFDVYGSGVILREAIMDLKKSIVDYYKTLVVSNIKLSKHLQQKAALLRNYIQSEIE